MSSRAEQKKRLREEREARERAAAAQEQRRKRLILLAASAVAALAVVGVLIAVSQGGGGDGGGLGKGERLAGTGEVRALYRGIPQSGATLGNAKAPVTMVEFADLQCPFCAQYTRDTLPTLVKRYVRSGKVKMELRPITIIGPDSGTAHAAAAAAAERNRLWQFADLVYLNQGQENSGYVTEDFLSRIARGAGLDPGPIVTASQTPNSVPLLRQATAESQRYGITSTPSFLVGRTGGSLKQLSLSSLEPAEFTAVIDDALKAVGAHPATPGASAKG
jgi:protein-disulfide isomerase